MSLRRVLRRLRTRATMKIGRINRTAPLSRQFGFDRGTPIDRYYIEAFLAAHADDIRGRVLEIGDAEYSRRFGGAKIVEQDILHAHAGNPAATIVGDLSAADVLPGAQFDCIVLTQTLHLIFDMRAAVAQLRRALKPGGVLLITVPGITAIDRFEWRDSWYWSLTGGALRRLLCEAFDREQVAIRAFGNLYAATAFLHGAAVEEVNPRKLDREDAAYPVVVAARAVV